MEEFGKRLKKLLALHKKTQSALANHLGYQQPTISQWIAGKRSLNLKDIFDISDFLNISVEYLFIDKKDSVNFLSIDGLNEEQIKAISLIVDDLKEANYGKE